MNQILVTIDNNLIFNNLTNNTNKKKNKYFIIFIFSISIGLIISFYLLFSYFSKQKEKEKTLDLKNKYSINTLYSESSSYEAIKLSDSISIIGLIEIPKISISYPILKESNSELLKISVCRFSGPMPNKIGNLCVAGHNYKSNSMFSKLHKLNIGDSIFITDLNNVKLEYVVYDKFKVKQNNLECTKSSNNVEITLITCNDNNNKERVVIKAKMKG